MSLYTGKNKLIQSENRIENVKGRSTSSEVDPEYFGAKRRLSFKNENIRCDNCSEQHSLEQHSGERSVVFMYSAGTIFKTLCFHYE